MARRDEKDLENFLATKHLAVPVSRALGGELVVAFADHLDLEARAAVRGASGLIVESVSAERDAILRAIERCYSPI